MPEQSETVDLEVVDNDRLPPILVDTVMSNKRTDGMILLQFYANMPGILAEQGRFMGTTKAVEEIIDQLCTDLGHYPKEPAKKRAVTAKKRTPKK
jgi:hypothetical protein